MEGCRGEQGRGESEIKFIFWSLVIETCCLCLLRKTQKQNDTLFQSSMEGAVVWRWKKKIFQGRVQSKTIEVKYSSIKYEKVQTDGSSGMVMKTPGDKVS